MFFYKVAYQTSQKAEGAVNGAGQPVTHQGVAEAKEDDCVMFLELLLGNVLLDAVDRVVANSFVHASWQDELCFKVGESLSKDVKVSSIRCTNNSPSHMVTSVILGQDELCRAGRQ